MNRNRLIIFGLAGLFAWGSAIAVTYFGMSHFRKSPPSEIIDTAALIRNMDLTEQQKEKLGPMEAALQKDLRSIQLQLAENRMSLCELLGKDESGPQMDAYTNRVAALVTEQQRRVVKHLMEIRTVLNPEQKQKLFSSLMQGICQGCRTMEPNEKCLCGMCDTKHG